MLAPTSFRTSELVARRVFSTSVFRDPQYMRTAFFKSKRLFATEVRNEVNP